MGCLAASATPQEGVTAATAAIERKPGNAGLIGAWAIEGLATAANDTERARDLPRGYMGPGGPPGYLGAAAAAGVPSSGIGCRCAQGGQADHQTGQEQHDGQGAA